MVVSAKQKYRAYFSCCVSLGSWRLTCSPSSSAAGAACGRGMSVQLPRDDPAVDVPPRCSGRQHVRHETVRKNSRRRDAAGLLVEGSRAAGW